MSQRKKTENQSTQNPPKRDVNAAIRVTTALELRASGAHWEDIAQQCGYGSAGAAYKAVQRELQRRIARDVDEMRREELFMLSQLHKEVWKLAIDEDNKGRLFAVDRILAIAERRARLMGLDVRNDSDAATACVVVREVPADYFGDTAPPVVEGAKS